MADEAPKVKRGPGNPNWRKKPLKDAERAIEIACRRYTDKALALLVRFLDDEEIDKKYRFMAAKEVLDRAWGKPRVSVESTVTHTSSDDLINAIRQAQRRVVPVQATEAAEALVAPTAPIEVH